MGIHVLYKICPWTQPGQGCVLNGKMICKFKKSFCFLLRCNQIIFEANFQNLVFIVVVEQDLGSHTSTNVSHQYLPNCS